MGSLIYELSSAQNQLANAVGAKCVGTILTSRDALCGSSTTVDESTQKLDAPHLTYGGFPDLGNKKTVVFTDFKNSAAERFLRVSGGNGSAKLRKRVAWMLFNVHLGDTTKRCGANSFEVEESFCKVFLLSSQGC
ncbi:uncharacterized protein LOC125946669 [Dermacentor silvarum]|uniref:uncharacterized protein LOC125946669 n=1 Tax=Dermacentor silvarum TaxID=543639 RepID=UPI00210096BC|nr:uncharacterized protein LOC125946669 [Dermacentor silvarum]